jgi:hypothetical protein
MATTTGDLFKALKTAWDGEATLSGFGGPYRDREPAATSPAFPYVVIKLAASDLAGMTNVKEKWNHRISLEVYNATPELVSAHAGVIGDVLDDLLPTLDTGKGRIARVRRLSEAIDEADKGVWRFVLTYGYLRSKDRS